MAEEPRQTPEPPRAPDPTSIPEAPFIPDPPIIPPTAPAAAPVSAIPEPNYHIFLWPDPPDPSLYLCLLCTLRDPSEAVIRAHVTSEHSVEPLPTPMAANPPVIDPVMGLQIAVTREEGKEDG